MPALRSALRDITPADIQRLVDDAWTEDETLEFKRTLSTRDGSPHPWLTRDAELGGARGDLLSEVVAMANSYGGDVILGIEEADEAPPRASAIVQIRRCVDLAHRIEMAARDLVKPQIPLLGVRGIPIDGDAGVVVIRAPRSRMAPHRLEIKGAEKECYRRVSDRSEAMSMREIQELTLSTARGLDKVDSRLAELRKLFRHWYAQRGAAHQTVAFSICAVPLLADPYVPRVHGDEAIRPVNEVLQMAIGDRGYPLTPPGRQLQWRPILRGTKGVGEKEDQSRREIRLYCDGGFIDMAAVMWRRDAPVEPNGRRYLLYPGWFLGSIFCAFASIDRYRRVAGADTADFALTAEIAIEGRTPVMGMDETETTTVRSDINLPRYQVGERDTWDDLARLIWEDFWNALGETKGDFVRITWPR